MQNSQLRKPPFRRLSSSGSGGQGSPVIPVITQVQKQAYISTVNSASHQVVLGSAPVQGNMLILGVVSDTTTTAPPAGWTLAISSVMDTGSYIYYKVAGAAESPTITVNLSASDSCLLFAMEYSLLSALDQTASGSSIISTTVPTGTTAATTAANELIVTVVGIGQFSIATAVSSWDNGVSAQMSGRTSGTVILGGLGAKVVSATGTQTSNATLNGTGTAGSIGLIATFK